MKYTYEQMATLVRDNNKSLCFSDEFIICLIWKESGFDSDATNSMSTATGLMQITKSAVEMVNSNTPNGTHYKHSDMTDAVKNIQCGSYYLDIAKNKLNGIDTGYGTGEGYSKSIMACEISLKSDKDHYMVALHKIHK
ncbi:transglycosylase SLT domain-containing protein [Methylomonas montana]|uniref:transglycosylase SLT domain-containing protein n=1 Tax=Methylomonas montana TaxID=3058963 RepID=UPI002658369D|nr:transglycosylase SLT domain-containing protein [Methylomonas montana]WKJ91936.1 transglycosylase SLT domain-containing protein [Methylomonas montana]